MKKNIKTPKISILIRAFNESKWINICLKKINEQSIKPFEIIVVDNNSNDGTIEIIKKFYKKTKIYKYNQNYAPGKMLNFGMSKCKGDYILITFPYAALTISILLLPDINWHMTKMADIILKTIRVL